MRSITFDELLNVNASSLIIIKTIKNEDFYCYKRFTYSSGSNSWNYATGSVNVFGYRLINESEQDIYINGLELVRTITRDQIGSIWLPE